MNIDEKLKELGVSLPKATDPVGSYVATKKAGNLLFISGQISINENGELIKGYKNTYKSDQNALKFVPISAM